MRAVTVPEPGGPDALVVAEVPDPEPRADEVLVEVVAAGVNRADVMQRLGHYPPPPGVTDVLGLECSGRVLRAPADSGWSEGDEVCALLSGGAYAERVAVPVGQLMPVPDGVGLVEAAALPEVAATVWSNVFARAGLRAGETLLVHSGGSGIGTMAIQLARAYGARVAVTAGSQHKLDACRELGAEILVDYHAQDFVDVVREATGGHGADVVLDNMGASYLDRNVDVLATEGRLVVIGMQGGVKGELNLGRLLARRGSVHATSLRARPADEKAEICAALRSEVWPLVASGRVRPVVHSTHALDDVADAHRVLDESSHIGKVLLTTGADPGPTAGSTR